MGTSAPSGTTATVSPPALQAERPPRLATAINNVIVDPDRTTDGSDTLPGGEALTAPRLTEIMEWIANLLDDDAGWSKVWEAEGGLHPHPEQLDATGLAEEAWAKGMDELFLGTAYGGPSIIANLPESELFDRFAASSSDPAYSLFVACQHLTTYGALGRGLSFTDDLKRCSMPANQSAAGLPVFTSGKGQWYTSNPTGVGPTQPGAPPPTAPAKKITPEQAFNADVVVTVAPGFGGGTIYTYNPLGHTETIPTDAWFGDTYVGPDGKLYVDPKVATPLVVATGNAVTEANKMLQDAAKAVSGAIPGLNVAAPQTDMLDGVVDALAPLGIPEHLKARAGKVPANLPVRGIQLEGSHISMVLRKYTTSSGPPPHQAVQMFDTTGHGMPPGVGGSSESTLRDYPMFAPLSYNGIYGGEAYGNGQSKIPSGTGRFVGMGTLPPLADASAIDGHLKRARPVGVARLVIIDTRANPKEPTVDDVVFISRAVLMWSTASPTRNYSISRLLFSLRNTPHRKALKAYWVVYAPRNQLSVSMWADGARTRGLDEMEGVEEKVYNVAMCVAILGHDDDGRAQEIWRNRTGSSNGSPPRILRSLFVDTWGPSLDWLRKKSAALVKAYTDELARRESARLALDKERSSLAPRAQKGDQVAIDRIKQIDEEKKAITEAPLPEVDAAREFAADPLAEEHQPAQMQARNRLQRVYSAVWLGSVTLPPLLAGA